MRCFEALPHGILAGGGPVGHLIPPSLSGIEFGVSFNVSVPGSGGQSPPPAALCGALTRNRRERYILHLPPNSCYIWTGLPRLSRFIRHQKVIKSSRSRKNFFAGFFERREIGRNVIYNVNAITFWVRLCRAPLIVIVRYKYYKKRIGC